MKCPHCGMNIRDTVTVCGYCGGEIQKQDRVPRAGTLPHPSLDVTQKEGPRHAPLPDEDLQKGEPEEGGFSAYLKHGEQVLIGSMNVSVKKFFFHAYLTNQRIFLIDTQEKKLKVTAKDVPLDTIVGSIVEFSETSDPVLVLSIRSADDEVKTTKIAFVQEGVDRTEEVDEWIALLSGQKSPKAEKKTEPLKQREVKVPAPAEPVAVREYPAQVRPVAQHELHPAKKTVKHHEMQPPVKRIVSAYKIPETRPAEDIPLPEHPAPRQTAPARLPQRKPVVVKTYDRESPPAREEPAESPKKPQVQSAMKAAMKNTMQPLRQPSVQQAKKPGAEPPQHTIPVQGPEERAEPSRRPTIQEKSPEPAATGQGIPQFCHNCGKKLPDSTNFCPGCGTRLSPHRTLPRAPQRHTAVPPHDRRMQSEDKKPSRQIPYEEEEREEDKPQPVKPPVKKAPKESEMTILHKFLRR